MHKIRTLVLAAGCTAAGALGTGALGAGAHDGGGRHGMSFGHPHFFGGILGAVHAEAVLPARDGDFKTVVFDRGIVKSVSGNDLTVDVGTKDHTYKTDTFTVPDGATIRRWGSDDAKLSDLQAGDRVAIVRSPKKYFVLAAPADAGTDRRFQHTH